MNKTVLIVDDDRKIGHLIAVRLRKQGYLTSVVQDGRAAMEWISLNDPALVFLDVRLPDIHGVEVLKGILKTRPKASVIMISAHADVRIAVECIKLGAFDFLEKPFEFPAFDAKVSQVFRQLTLEEEVATLKKELGAFYKDKSLVGKSEAMIKVFQAIESAAQSDANVLIEGESGTGKELVARTIHFNGFQRQGPFVAVNCAAIPENLLESELFGHEKGAFTGAVARRIGKFEQAQGGTFFLDEIGDLPLSLQVKLLRVLQEKEIERVGGDRPIPIRVRFIVATHRDLRELMAAGKFREDLYFRVNVFPIRIPPLRERREDIPELLKYFLRKNHPEVSSAMDSDALNLLMNHAWPGNIRELENFIERLVLVNKDRRRITSEVLRPLLERGERAAAFNPSPASVTFPAADTLNCRDKEALMGNTEKAILENALKQAGGNITKASKLISVSRDTFYRKMKKYSITVSAFSPSPGPLARE